MKNLLNQDDFYTSLNKDEIPVPINFSGYHEAASVELDGWSRCYPVKGSIPIKENLLTSFATFDLNSNNLPKNILDIKYLSVPLEKLSNRAKSAGSNFIPHSETICVQVIAKKILEAKNEKKEFNKRIINVTTLTGNILVADESGYSELLLFNDGICCFYDKVEIGDTLLVADSSFRKRTYPSSSKTTLNLYFPKYLELTLKVTQYQSRHTYKAGSIEMPLQKFPDFIYQTVRGNEKILFTPSIINQNEFKIPEDYTNFDLIGVISFVGRMERTRIAKYSNQGKGQTDIIQYNVTRWIEVIDKSGSKVSILLYINYDTIALMDSLIVMKPIVLTNLQVADENIWETKHLISSQYTYIYLDQGILFKYLEIMPDIFGLIVQEEKILRSENFVLDLYTCVNNSNNNKIKIEFAAGGTIRPKLKRLDMVPRFNLYNNKIDHSFVRRESAKIVFVGKIISFCNELTNESYKCEQTELEIKQKSNILEIFSSTTLDWFIFKHCFINIDSNHNNINEIFKEDKIRNVQLLSKCFGFPYSVNKEVINIQSKEIGKESIIKLEIYNNHSNQIYKCIALDSDKTFQNKIKESFNNSNKNNNWVFYLNVYCIDTEIGNKPGLEIVLVDLVQI